MSERTREKLVYMGRTLRVYISSRVKSPSLAKTTHIHLIGQTETGRPGLFEVEIKAAFHPSVALEFERLSLLHKFLHELPNSAFSFGYDRVADVEAEIFDDRARATSYTLGSGPIGEGCAIHESLERFFINKGYVANSDIVSREENGSMKTYVRASSKRGPTFLRKLSAVPGGHQDQLVPTTFAETCNICRSDKKPTLVEDRTRFQVETRSRQELDFRPTGSPKIKSPRQKVTSLTSTRQIDTTSSLKRKASTFTHQFFYDTDFFNSMTIFPVSSQA